MAAAAASGAAAYSPCPSPTKQPGSSRLSIPCGGWSCSPSATSPVRLASPRSFGAAAAAASSGRKQPHHRRLCISVSASGSPTPSASSPCSSAGGHYSPQQQHGCSPVSGASHSHNVQPLLLHSPSSPYLLGPSHHQRPQGFCAPATRFGSAGSSLVCRSAAQGGANGPSSTNGDRDSSGSNSGTDFDPAGRAVSPISTAEQPLSSAFDNSNSSHAESGGVQGLSTSTSSSPELQEQDVVQQQQQQRLNPPAVALPLPRVASSPSAASAAMTATAAAAAAAEAAVAGVLDTTTATDSAAIVGEAATGDLQDLFTLLKFQVQSSMPPAQLAATLVPIVRSAAANQLSLGFVTSGERHLLLVQLMGSEDADVAVLAAEAWCRVCGNADLEPWTDAMLPAVPVLLSLIDSNSAPKDGAVPLLFFAVSSLVRMASLPAVATAVRVQGGLPLLVAALDVVPAAICQVTTFALFRLMREVDGDMTDDQLSNWSQQPPQQARPREAQQQDAVAGDGITAQQEQEQEVPHELALLTYVRAGAFSKLCQVLALVEEGSAHELAFSMLLSLSLIPAAQQLVADQGEVQELVQVMANPPSSNVRLETMLVLGRLAARNRACQQDAVREGVVPVLVDMMRTGSEEERCHACRLLAILGQHETTHQLIKEAGAIPVMLQLLRNHGLLDAAVESAQHSISAAEDPAVTAQLDSSASTGSVGDGDAEQQHADDDDDDEAAEGSDSSTSTITPPSASSGSSSSMFRTSGPFKAAKRPQPAAAAAAATAGSSNAAIGPGLVLEQAAGLACMLCHNADNHFTLVNQGIVPLLVGLLQQGTAPKTVTYTMASLLMLCMGDSRNAAVVARAGAIPALVSVAREATNRPANRELASALLAVMCRSQAAQVDVVASGGIPALTRLLAEGTEGACCSAAEALTQIATTSDVRCRLIVRAGALPHLIPMLQPNSNPMSLLWAARLLKALAQERNTLWEVCETPGLLSLLPDILNRRPQQPQTEQQLILEFRAAAAAAAAAAGGGSRTVSTDSSQAMSTAAAGAQAGGAQQQQQEEEGGSAEEDGSLDGVSAASEAESLAKAQAHIAWLLAALASDGRSREIMAELASFLVRPLVMLLRDSQEAAGPGYTLHDVLHGMANNRQAAASAALRALGKHVRIAGLIQNEIALQHWMGFGVQLPKAVGEWPPPTPGWFLNVDLWSPDGHAEDDRASWP